MALGVEPSRIVVYERFQDQLAEVDYAPHLPEGVLIVAAESANRRIDNSGYDPATYVEADLFGEEDTRSNLMSLVSRRLTKIINIPNMKDHGATGATGCLKNIAYGSFSNVARTHYQGQSHTCLSWAPWPPSSPSAPGRSCRSWTACAGCGTGGRSRVRPATSSIRSGSSSAPTRWPSIACSSTSSTLKRKGEGAISIWERSPLYLKTDDAEPAIAIPT